MSVRYALLGLLAHHSRHGYELRAAFEAMMGGHENWDLSPAQVYSTLDRLQVAGLIRPVDTRKQGGPERRTYALTPAGRKELRGWLAEETPLAPARDEFFLKVMLALASGTASPARMIQQQRSALYRRLHAVTTRRRDTDPGSHLAHVLLLDKVVMHLEADLRWLDMIEARLEEVRQQPIPEPMRRPRGRPPKTGRIP